MLRQLRSCVLALVIFVVLLGLAYPLAITGAGQLLWPHQANGSRVERDGRLIGSALIGQSFDGLARYFQSRPSASAYNAADAAASNLGPNSARLSEQLRARLAVYLQRERAYDPGLTAAEVPADAVTASASGVDPDISAANALIQAHRVAAVRRLPIATVVRLISQSTHSSAGGLFGPAAVDVLTLNLALDEVSER